jgi:hypothetical protein
VKRGRRINGSGSVYHRSDKGLWAAEITLREGPARKRRRFYGRTPGEAEAKLERFLERLPDALRRQVRPPQPPTSPGPGPDRLLADELDRLELSPELRELLKVPREAGALEVGRVPALRWQDAEWLAKLALTLEAAANAGDVRWAPPFARRVAEEVRAVIQRNRGGGVTWLEV